MAGTGESIRKIKTIYLFLPLHQAAQVSVLGLRVKVTEPEHQLHIQVASLRSARAVIELGRHFHIQKRGKITNLKKVDRETLANSFLRAKGKGHSMLCCL